MSEEVKAALILVGVPILFGWIDRRRVERKTNAKIADVHTLINSRMSELIDSTKTAATLEGHAAGVAEERANPS
jgi:hypothetical protein